MKKIFFNEKENPLIIHGRLVRDKTDGHTEEGKIECKDTFLWLCFIFVGKVNIHCNLLIFANKVLYMLADCGRVYFPKVFQIRSAVGRLCVNRKRNNAISTHV